MFTSKIKFTSTAFLLLLFTAQTFAGYEFYVTVTGTRQGEFKGESVRYRYENKIPGYAFSMEMSVPTDIASGMPSGKVVTGPVVFKKLWGSSTPQFMQALVSSERLIEATFEFLSINPDGSESVYFTISIGDAIVTNVKYEADYIDGPNSEYEEISINYQNISISDLNSGATASYNGMVLGKSEDNLAKPVSFSVFKDGPRVSLPLNSRACLMDLAGKPVRTFNVTGKGELMATELNVPSGLYVIRVAGQKAMTLPVHVK